MTYQMDRTYWRATSTRALIDAARHSGDELAIALGERLEEFENQETIIDDLQRANAELEQRVDVLYDEIQILENQLEQI